MSEKQRYFKKSLVDKEEIICMLASMLSEHQDLHKFERKRLLEKSLQKAYHCEDWKISIYHFEWISRRAEKLNLALSNMSFNEAKAGVLHRVLKIACDPSAQNRDRIMADQLISNMAGLDAKFSGGFEEDMGDELAEALAAIGKDEQHGLNSDEPPE